MKDDRYQKDFNNNDNDENQLFFDDQMRRQNDSLGNNSGGCRSQRDDDFNLFDDLYQRKVQNKIQQQQKQHQDGEIQNVEIGPQNNPKLKQKSNNNKQPQISFYDIEVNLSSKNISILSYKKTLDTISQYLNAFQMDELIKFIKLILDLPSFGDSFQKYEKRKQKESKKMEVQQQMNETFSDISAKSDESFLLPSNGIQTILQIVSFIRDLLDKCSLTQNRHLIALIKEVLCAQSRFYNLPLNAHQLVSNITQFVQNTSQKYQSLLEQIQSTYYSLFQFTDEVQIKQIWFSCFSNRLMSNFFIKRQQKDPQPSLEDENNNNDSKNKISLSQRISCIKLLNQINQGSPELYLKFNYYREEQNYLIFNKADLLKLNKQQLEDYSNVVYDFSYKSEKKILKYISPFIAALVHEEASIDKKSLSLKIIDKLISNTKVYPETVQILSQILEQHTILQSFFKDQTHAQLLRKLPPIAKFLYQLEKLPLQYILRLIKQSITAHEQFFKAVNSILLYVKVKHLEQIFHFIKKLIMKQDDLLNQHIVGLVQNVVNNIYLSMNKRKKKHHHGSKKQTSNKNNNNQSQLPSIQDHPLIYDLFNFLYKLVQISKLQNLYIPIVCKHISIQVSLLLPILQLQFTNRLIKPKNYESFIISILDHCLKIDMDSLLGDTSNNHGNVVQKKEVKIHLNEQQNNTQGIKYQFINNLIQSCNLYDSILVILCRKRFDRNIVEKCLNILILVTKSYKPLQKSHIQLLWKILGLHSTSQFEKQQFFQFIKEILKNSINLSQESVKHIYFQIILKLHYDWFTLKIYDCFEMLFMRLNEDGKLLIYENNIIQNNSNISGLAPNQNISSAYLLNKTQLVGIQKFFYLYFWADSKVSKKVKDFLFKLYSYKSSPEIKQKFSFQLIHFVLKYIKRNPQSQDHILYAKTQDYFEQHVIRAFDFFSKFIQSSKSASEQNAIEQNMITINIQNVTRQALPPVKKLIQVNKNMLLKDFKDLVRKQINPPVKQIQLMNKGKPLKVQKMSLKQLKIQNKNTIYVQNLDMPVPKKQVEEKRLKQCKQTLTSIFGEQFSAQMLSYVAEKYMGEQLQKICEFLMDQDKVKQIQNELREKVKQGQKIQEEQLQINLQKKDTATEILTFGQILAKQILYLLDVIKNKATSSNRATIQKQWAIVKKIPANLEMVIKIQGQLQKNPQGIRYQEIFKFRQNQSSSKLNYQTYTWYLFKRIISSKSNEMKRKIFEDGYKLQTFIIQKLEELINNQIYSDQLYTQMLQLYDIILGFQSQCKQMMSQKKIKNKQKTQLHQNPALQVLFSSITNEKGNSSHNFFPNSVFNNVNEIIINSNQLLRKYKFVFFSPKFSPKQLLNQMLKNNVFDKKVASRLFGLLLLDLLSDKNRQKNQIKYKNNLSLMLDKKAIFNLILIYKQIFLKFYLTVLVIESKTANETYESNEHRNGRVESYKQNYLYLKDYILEQKHENSMIQEQKTELIELKMTKQWLFYLLIGYIQLVQVYQNSSEQKCQSDGIFEVDLLNWIQLLSKNYLALAKNQLIGILLLISKLTEKIFIYGLSPRNNKFVQHNENLLLKFIDFLMSDFIFQLTGVPILTQNLIKEHYYQILISLTSASNTFLLKIADKVIKFGVEKRNHDNDTIDFKKSQFVGIQNLGSTCYINSLIQQLYHTRLPYKLLSLTRQEGVFQLNHAFMQLYMSTKNVINIRPMIQQVKFYGQEIIPTIQQDAEQFLISLLDYIESCNGKQIIDSIFGGSYSQQLTYFSGQNSQNLQNQKIYKKHKQEHFYNITLDIKGKKTLNQALTYNFRSQVLDDKIYCQQLQQKTSVVKRSFIKNFPKILIFTLKRFEYDVQNMSRNKVNDYLQFPMKLDLTEFSLENFLEKENSQSKDHAQSNIIRNDLQTNKTNNFNSQNDQGQNKKGKVKDSNSFSHDFKPQSDSQSHLYKLVGILIHSGSAQTGHYYSYIQRNKKWYQFNDRLVVQINLPQKIKAQCFGGGDAKSRNAYMLFYQKQQINPVAIANDSCIKKYENYQKMQIQEQQSAMIEQKQANNNELQKTIPLSEQNEEAQLCHHGSFLENIPASNYFKQLVQQQNKHFIKQRLVYDLEYRKFIELLIRKFRDAKQNNAYQSTQSKKLEYILSQKLSQVEKINLIINPRQEKPIVYYASNDIMEEQMKQITYEQQQKMNENIKKQGRQTDIVQEIWNQNNQSPEEFI